MSTILYNRGGDYDPSHSRGLKLKGVGSPVDHFDWYYPEGGAEPANFVAIGPLGDHVYRHLSIRTDGVFADLSDAFRVRLGGSNVGDVLIGGAGSDAIYGHLGNDRLIGGGGADRIDGGKHDADTFVYLSPSDSTQKDSDKLINFSGAAGDGDRIDLTAIADFMFIGSAAFHGSGTAEIRTEHMGRSLVVFCDVDGDGVLDMRIGLTGMPGDLTAADFVGASSAVGSHGTPFAEAHPIALPAFAEPLHSLAHLALA